MAGSGKILPQSPKGWFAVMRVERRSYLALINSNLACGAAAVNNAARVMFAMGRGGSLPGFLGKVHPHHRTPYVAVIAVLITSSITTYAGGDSACGGGCGVVFKVTP